MKHPSAVCEASVIGRDTQLEANTFVGKDVVIGERCFLRTGASVEGKTQLGHGVSLGAGARIVADAIIDDDVRFEAGCCIGAMTPGQSVADKPTKIATGVFVAANVVVHAGVSVGRHAWLDVGTVVHGDVPPYAIVRGNPAIIDGYRTTPERTSPASSISRREASRVKGVSWVDLPAFKDMRGDLVVAEFEKHLPFMPKRTFIVHNVPNARIRGEHAHRACHQILVCVAGSVHVLTDDGTSRQDFRLDSPAQAIHLAPYVWGTQYNFSPAAALLVFASHAYAADDYIRVYEEFLSEATERSDV